VGESQSLTACYAVNNLYPTIQGEGVLTGIPMLLLRLQGCDVGCPFCDTKESWSLDQSNQHQSLKDSLGSNELFSIMSEYELLTSIKERIGNIKWILLTGGEPARFDLNPLLDHLHKNSFNTAIETSGTYHLEGQPTWLCVSPKFNMPGKRPLNAEVILRADELKFVLGKRADLETIGTILERYQTKHDVQICLQPVSQSHKATRICLEAAMETGWRLSLQTHKFIDIE